MICTAHPILCGFKIGKNEMGGSCSTMGQKRGLYWVFMRKSEGESPLEKPKHRWVDNITLSSGSGIGVMQWIDLAHRWQVRVNAVMKLLVP